MSITFPERFNMADYFLYHNVDEGRENKVCLYFEDRTWTYGAVVKLSNKTGNVFRELGVDIEDRILMVLPDCPEFVWTWFGAARVGAVITMVNPLLPAADYAYYLDYTRARAAIVHHSILSTFAEAVKDARHLKVVLIVGDYHGELPPVRTRFVHFDEYVDTAPDECPPADTRRDDVAIWLFTSTTRSSLQHRSLRKSNDGSKHRRSHCLCT